MPGVCLINGGLQYSFSDGADSSVIVSVEVIAPDSIKGSAEISLKAIGDIVFPAVVKLCFCEITTCGTVNRGDVTCGNETTSGCPLAESGNNSVDPEPILLVIVKRAIVIAVKIVESVWKNELSEESPAAIGDGDRAVSSV